MLIILNIIALNLTVVLLKNDVRPISFPPTTNAISKSTTRRGSKWGDCDFCCLLAEIFNTLKPEEWEALVLEQLPV